MNCEGLEGELSMATVHAVQALGPKFDPWCYMPCIPGGVYLVTPRHCWCGPSDPQSHELKQSCIAGYTELLDLYNQATYYQPDFQKFWETPLK